MDDISVQLNFVCIFAESCIPVHAAKEIQGIAARLSILCDSVQILLCRSVVPMNELLS